MFKSYFRIAWRSLMKNKTFSLINIFGLAIGLTCCMLITLYIVHETGYDRYQKDARRIYQVATAFTDDGGEHRSATTSAPVGRLLQQEYPEVQGSTRLLVFLVMIKHCSRLKAKRTGSIPSMKPKAF